jgi:hypothetical protein
VFNIMLSQFQVRQLRAIRALPLFQQFVDIQGSPTWEEMIETADAADPEKGAVTVLAYLTDGRLTAHRIGQRRVVHSVTV